MSASPPPTIWDQHFSAAGGYKYGEQPNAFLVQQAARLPLGARILLPGDGEGRNGVWLAEQGHQVTSVDGSSKGLARAQDLARRRGVTLDTVHADLADWSPEPVGFEAVVSIYLHLPPSLRPAVHRKLVQTLHPGGLLILEAFHPDQLPLASGGPKDAAMLYTLPMLRDDFGPGLQELLAEETGTVLDEGPGHHGPARVTRWVGRKAAAA